MESNISIKWTKENFKAVKYRFKHPTKDIIIKFYNFDLFEKPRWSADNCGAVTIRHADIFPDYLSFDSTYTWESLEEFEKTFEQLKHSRNLFAV